jgi:hypothetical protein
MGLQFSLKSMCALLIIGGVIGGCYGAYLHGRSVSDISCDAVQAIKDAEESKAIASMTESNRAEEQRRQSRINEVEKGAREKKAAANIDGLEADAAGERLHGHAQKMLAGARCPTSHTGAPSRSDSATRAAMVLSDLLQRTDERAGELAKAYDSARIAASTCVEAYESLRAEHAAGS